MIKKTKHPVSRVFWFLASLKLAILVLVGLALSLSAGTVLESLYDTPTAQYFVYRAFWFRGLLLLLGVNILVVALSRFPWKKRHFPFLLAHAGILILLLGAWMTDRFGLDGSMRISEGEISTTVELDQPQLYISEGANVRTIPIEWLPPGVKFKPFTLASRGVDYDLKVDQFISHADGDYQFIPNADSVPAASPAAPKPAAKIRVQGGPMRISQDFWLWAGQPQWMAYQAGPAFFAMGEEVPLPPQGPKLQLLPQKDGSVSYKTISSDGEVVKATLKPGMLDGQALQAKWKGGVTLTLLQWVPDATLVTTYRPSHTQYREMAPPSAIHLVAGEGGKNSEVWLGLGERAVLTANGKQVELGYFRKRVTLPFVIQLNHFSIDRYQGSMSPSSYASEVTVHGFKTGDQPQVSTPNIVISMNEPLKYRGLTFYQASYEDAMPRPTTSIFSVNRDPGRPWKYLGSLLLVFGSISLFVVKFWRTSK